jgi:hypothetical protein
MEDPVTDTRTPHALALPGAADDPDHELVERLQTLHPPRDADIAARMDEIRAAYKRVEHLVVDLVPRTPDRTVAIRDTHRAGMAAIASLACNQGLVPTNEN